LIGAILLSTDDGPPGEVHSQPDYASTVQKVVVEKKYAHGCG
jgi:hypothetical protein